MSLILVAVVGSCQPKHVVGNLGAHDASPTAVSIKFTLNGNSFGWPEGAFGPCDEFVARGPDNDVRGTGTNTTLGWDIGVLETPGERIGFYYWSSVDNRLYHSTYVFIMQDDASFSTYLSPLVMELSQDHSPCSACAYYSLANFSFAVPSGSRCVESNGVCRYEPASDTR
eukprot:7382196-Prymnesium_polylepis.1